MLWYFFLLLTFFILFERKLCKFKKNRKQGQCQGKYFYHVNRNTIVTIVKLFFQQYVLSRQLPKLNFTPVKNTKDVLGEVSYYFFFFFAN